MSLSAIIYKFPEDETETFEHRLADRLLLDLDETVKASEWLLLRVPGTIMLFQYGATQSDEKEVTPCLLEHGLLPAPEKMQVSTIKNHEAIRLFLQIGTGIFNGKAEWRIIETLRATYAQASEYGFVGPVFHRLFQRSIWLHEKARMETDFFRFAHEPARVFSEIARKIFGHLKSVTAHIIGKDARLLDWINALHQEGCRKFIFLGEESEVAEIPAQYAVQVLSPARNPIIPANVDLLLFFSSQNASLDVRAISRRMSRRNNAALLIYNGNAANHEKERLKNIYNVFYYDQRDLQYIIEHNQEKQLAELEKIEPWIAHEVEAFYQWLESDSHYQFAGIVGTTREMQRIFELISRIAQMDITVLIQGESGTGKELVARAIHQLSLRAEKPFVVVNCGAIPENLLESELFGHVKGAFTGAFASKMGLFEEAHGGTIFLDEIGELPATLQVKLLRFLQEGEIKRVGSNETLKLDVRVLAATNRDLAQMVDNGQFRSDLFYRLNVIQINIPPLRDRQEDIVVLAHHFMKNFAARLSKDVNEISAEALSLLQRYHWPGNVRELENAIEHAVALTVSNTIEAHDLPPVLQASQMAHYPQANANAKRLTLKEIEKRYILETLENCQWNYDFASKQLGIGRTTLWRKLREYNLHKENS
ncbi:MAG: AAA family ATPase [Calditrichaeota bacterium]|nr:MAG: AAA family ATPase [Calditrichota bacterium]